MKLFKRKKAKLTQSEHKSSYEQALDEVEEISPSQYKQIVQQSTGHHHHHHHHSHKSHHSSHSKHKHSRSNTVTDFSAEDIQKRTDEYTGAHSIERPTPRHPHPHDKIAHDSKYSAEELDELNSVKISSFNETGIEQFKQGFDDYISKPSHHHRHRRRSNKPEHKTDEVPEDFDVDSFLSDISSHQNANQNL